MKAKLLLALATVLRPPALRAGEDDKWTFDVSLYGLAAGMSGEIGVGPIDADVDIGFDQIWDNLEMGGMGRLRAGSDLTWQAFPYLGWQFAKWGSLQAGYRWVDTNDETGSGASRFKYDMLTQGPQVGVPIRF